MSFTISDALFQQRDTSRIILLVTNRHASFLLTTNYITIKYKERLSFSLDTSWNSIILPSELPGLLYLLSLIQ